MALNTQLVDNLTDKGIKNANETFVIRDSGGASFVIDGKSYSLGNGGNLALTITSIVKMILQ